MGPKGIGDHSISFSSWLMYATMRFENCNPFWLITNVGDYRMTKRLLIPSIFH